MIESELLLLGLLKEGPKHGYEIKIKIQEILSIFAGVDLKSIYYPLRILERKGLVLKHCAKSGKRPERLIYKLTPRGEKRFQELLAKSLLDFRRPQFSLDLSLYFLPFMKPHAAKRRLRARLRILNKIAKGMSAMAATFKKKKASPLLQILEHNLRMIGAESNFLSDLIKTVR